MKQYEHYQKLICENSKFYYYASSKGYISRVDKTTHRERIQTPYMHHNRLRVKVSSKDYNLAALIAKTFMRDYKDKCCVGYKDGNITNCSIDNLFLYSYSDHGRKTGYLSRSHPVIVHEFKKEPVRYRSVREAAKALYCSYQTLLDYLKGASKHSVLKKYGRKIYYEPTINI